MNNRDYIREWPYAVRAWLVALLLAIMATGCAVQKDPDKGRKAASTDEPIAQLPAESNQATHSVTNSVTDVELREEIKTSAGVVQGQESMGHDQLVVTSRAPGVPMANRLAGKVESEAACCDHFTRWATEPLDRENYQHFDENPVKLVAQYPVSTFSVDVDTGAYSNVRRFLNAGSLPPEDAVRIEELINYFSYEYPVPANTDRPFSVITEVATAPWNDDKLLLQIGIKGYEVPVEDRPPANLVFLIDVSGSMNSPDKLQLLKNSLKMLTRQLRPEDRVSMVVYAGSSGVVLEPTTGDRQVEILRALDRLNAGGSTNGASGIRLAYQMAEQGLAEQGLAERGAIENGINRVILATDGDFNVGTVDFDALIDIVERKRELGISLTTLGFGSGNYNDHLMEQLADSGNGNYAYVDTLSEGRKVLVEELGSTLQTIAKDVKIQVEFNPEVVAEYRLIGYENRMLRREDFNNDKIDAGEIGAGHTVTALYELTLIGSSARLIDPLRYGAAHSPGKAGDGEIAFVRLRYKAPDGDTSMLIEQPVDQGDTQNIADASGELRFAASVAAFGQLLKGGEYTGTYDFADVTALATGARGQDPFGYRSGFLSLVRLADSLAATGQPDRRAMR